MFIYRFHQNLFEFNTTTKPVVVLLMILTVFSLPQKTSAQPIPPATHEPALWFRLVEMEDVWNHVIDLCRNTPYESPAKAVAALKSSGVQAMPLDKTSETLIAMFNPSMAKQVGMFDKSVFSIEPDVMKKQVGWRCGLFQTDGTFEALTTALALDYANSDTPRVIGGVERLGPNLFALRSDNTVYFAPYLHLLQQGYLQNIDQKIIELQPPIKSGIWLRANPQKWPASLGRNIQEYVAIQAIRRISQGSDVELRVFPWGESIQAECLDLFRELPVSPVKPSWIDRWNTALRSQLLAQASFGTDPRKPFWNQTFRILTDVERSIPGRERVASLRDRLNLAALLAKVSPETDLYPNLAGISLGATLPDDPRLPPTIIATLHALDPRATRILVEKVVIPTLRAIGNDPKTSGIPLPENRLDDQIRGIAIVQGRPMFLFIEGTDITLVWGARNVAERIKSIPENPQNPKSVALAWFDQFAKSGPVHRIATVNPETLARWSLMRGQKPSPWTEASRNLPPLVWLGRNQNQASQDILAFSGARLYVENLLQMVEQAEKATIRKPEGSE